ncbi:MAG: hypothetical protein ACOX7B_03185 [Christensenellales bacterium]|jgi:hypothetical protein
MKQEIRTTFHSPEFWLAVIIFFLSFFGYSLPRWFQDTDAPLEYKDTALQLSIGGIYFGGIQLILSFCASLIGATRQVEEVRGGVMRWRVLRLGMNRYMLRKLFSAALVTALAMAGAFLVQAILWRLIALPPEPATYPAHYNFYSEDSLYHDWYTVAHALPIYVSTATGIALNGAGIAWLSLAVAVWLPDKLIALVMPTLLISAYTGGFFREIFGISVPFFSDLYNDGLTISILWQAMAALIVMMALSAVLYRLGLERRVRHV